MVKLCLHDAEGLVESIVCLVHSKCGLPRHVAMIRIGDNGILNNNACTRHGN